MAIDKEEFFRRADALFKEQIESERSEEVARLEAADRKEHLTDLLTQHGSHLDQVMSEISEYLGRRLQRPHQLMVGLRGDSGCIYEARVDFPDPRSNGKYVARLAVQADADDPDRWVVAASVTRAGHGPPPDLEWQGTVGELGQVSEGDLREWCVPHLVSEIQRRLK